MKGGSDQNYNFIHAGEESQYETFVQVWQQKLKTVEAISKNLISRKKSFPNSTVHQEIHRQVEISKSRNPNKQEQVCLENTCRHRLPRFN